jgi:cytochrome c55X
MTFINLLINGGDNPAILFFKGVFKSVTRIMQQRLFVNSLLLFGLLVSFGSAVATEAPSETRKAELLHLLKHDCGSCHGLTLKGGLGPALTPQALTNKPKPFLVQTILAGRPGTPMPPWSTMLSKKDAEWLVHLMLKSDAHAQ